MVIAQWRGIGDREEGIGKMRNEEVPVEGGVWGHDAHGIYSKILNCIETYGGAGASFLLVMVDSGKAQQAGSSGGYYGPPNYPRRFCGFSPSGHTGARTRNDAPGIPFCRYCTKDGDGGSSRGDCVGYARTGDADAGWDHAPTDGDAGDAEHATAD